MTGPFPHEGSAHARACGGAGAGATLTIQNGLPACMFGAVGGGREQDQCHSVATAKSSTVADKWVAARSLVSETAVSGPKGLGPLSTHGSTTTNLPVSVQRPAIDKTLPVGRASRLAGRATIGEPLSVRASTLDWGDGSARAARREKEGWWILKIGVPRSAVR
jgi:hypothetical protein